MQDWVAVQEVYKKSKSKRATAKILGISRNTVKKLIALAEAPKYHRTDYKSILDDYKELIIEWRCDPYDFNGTRIFRELKMRGYDGSIGPVYRFLKKTDEDCGGHISAKATVRHESPPGDQAQFDWSEYEMRIGHKYRKVYCFAMILAASRKKAICFSLKADADAIYEAIQELYVDLGGITLELLIDNPRSLVIDNNPKSEEEIRYNPQALLLAKHLGTELNACPCYWPRKKGKVERPFNYIEQQFVKGSSFTTMAELNRRGKKFINEWCDEKHGTTNRIPNEHYALEERHTLIPLPYSRFRVKQLQRRIVSSDSYVSINSNKYSVPVKYVGKTVLFRIIYGFRIEIYDQKEVPILTLEAADDKHEILTNPEHYEPIMKKVSTSIPQIRRDFTQRFKNGMRYLDAAGRKFDQPTHYARKIMELQELYDDHILDLFIDYAVSHDMMDIKSFRKLLRDYNSGKLPLPLETGQTQSGTKGTGIIVSYRDDDPNLTRDCSYYEDSIKEATTP